MANFLHVLLVYTMPEGIRLGQTPRCAAPARPAPKGGNRDEPHWQRAREGQRTGAGVRPPGRGQSGDMLSLSGATPWAQREPAATADLGRPRGHAGAEGQPTPVQSQR